MLGSIKYNLTHLFDFRGRDARQTFWYYVLFLIALNVIAWIIAIVPLIGSVMQEAMAAAQAGLPQEEVSAKVIQGMGPGLASIAWFSIISSLLLTLLILASFTRRLHDSGKPGWWAGIILAIKLGTTAYSISNIGQIDEAMQAASAAAADPARLEQLQASQGSPMQSLIGLLAWAGPIIVIVFGVMNSTDGPNKYGEGSVRF